MGGLGGRSPPSRRARRPGRAAAAGGGSFMGSPLLDIRTIFRHMVTDYVPITPENGRSRAPAFLQNIPLSLRDGGYYSKYLSGFCPKRMGRWREVPQACQSA